ncbi:PEGA domain-containing protein [Methanocorpusculum sp. MG]|uniref:PEGA domain-containing protein n=1 Tax=Methanocorpusculum petauri TaxID=3002863 RepID=A0ABT4IJP9_9EURY|nr:PEGA domain-containing protein [Methanocorpusculum petauri]MCZ0861318.1 PEGA domain-containing protein [Methanocorpusculum petauri]
MKRTVVPVLFILIAALCIIPVAAEDAPGYIAVTTSPTGGQVYIDHTYVMDSPGTAEVRPGNHLVSIQSSEYFTWSDEVFVRSGETTKVDAVMQFYKGPGSIGITSSMPEVDVYIDDMYYASVKSGTVTIPNLSPTEHDVRVVKAGYHDFTTTVQVLSDKIVGVYSDQTKDERQAGVRVHSEPAGAVVFLDDDYAGITQSGNEWLQISAVSPGSHTLSFSKDGYAVSTITRVFKAGDVEDVRVTLQPVPVETTTAPTESPTQTAGVPTDTVPPAPTKTPIPVAGLFLLGTAGILLFRR